MIWTFPTENQFEFLQNPVFSQKSIDKYNNIIDENTNTNLTFNRQFDNNRLKKKFIWNND